MSLEAGLNTVVDKLATMTLEESEDLIALAKQKGLLVSESTVYLFHLQISQIQNIFEKKQRCPKLITMLFTMPHFTTENFRYKKEFGGAIMDTSPYAVSVGLQFFGSDPI